MNWVLISLIIAFISVITGVIFITGSIISEKYVNLNVENKTSGPIPYGAECPTIFTTGIYGGYDRGEPSFNYVKTAWAGTSKVRITKEEQISGDTYNLVVLTDSDSALNPPEINDQLLESLNNESQGKQWKLGALPVINAWTPVHIWTNDTVDGSNDWVPRSCGGKPDSLSQKPNTFNVNRNSTTNKYSGSEFMQDPSKDDAPTSITEWPVEVSSGSFPDGPFADPAKYCSTAGVYESINPDISNMGVDITEILHDEILKVTSLSGPYNLTCTCDDYNPLKRCQMGIGAYNVIPGDMFLAAVHETLVGISIGYLLTPTLVTASDITYHAYLCEKYKPIQVVNQPLPKGVPLSSVRDRASLIARNIDGDYDSLDYVTLDEHGCIDLNQVHRDRLFYGGYNRNNTIFTDSKFKKRTEHSAPFRATDTFHYTRSIAGYMGGDYDFTNSQIPEAQKWRITETKPYLEHLMTQVSSSSTEVSQTKSMAIMYQIPKAMNSTDFNNGNGNVKNDETENIYIAWVGSQDVESKDSSGDPQIDSYGTSSYYALLQDKGLWAWYPVVNLVPANNNCTNKAESQMITLAVTNEKDSNSNSSCRNSFTKFLSKTTPFHDSETLRFIQSGQNKTKDESSTYPTATSYKCTTSQNLAEIAYNQKLVYEGENYSTYDGYYNTPLNTRTWPNDNFYNDSSDSVGVGIDICNDIASSQGKPYMPSSTFKYTAVAATDESSWCSDTSNEFSKAKNETTVAKCIVDEALENLPKFSVKDYGINLYSFFTECAFDIFPSPNGPNTYGKSTIKSATMRQIFQKTISGSSIIEQEPSPYKLNNPSLIARLRKTQIQLPVVIRGIMCGEHNSNYNTSINNNTGNTDDSYNLIIHTGYTGFDFKQDAIYQLPTTYEFKTTVSDTGQDDYLKFTQKGGSSGTPGTQSWNINWISPTTVTELLNTYSTENFIKYDGLLLNLQYVDFETSTPEELAIMLIDLLSKLKKDNKYVMVTTGYGGGSLPSLRWEGSQGFSTFEIYNSFLNNVLSKEYNQTSFWSNVDIYSPKIFEVVSSNKFEITERSLRFVSEYNRASCTICGMLPDVNIIAPMVPKLGSNSIASMKNIIDDLTNQQAIKFYNTAGTGSKIKNTKSFIETSIF